jgi:predicted RecA/RadA family phage recombinase
MAFTAQFRSGDVTMVDHTPSGAPVSAGDVVVIGDVPLIAHHDIADGVKGALAAGGGVYKMKSAVALPTKGKRIYYNATLNQITLLTADKHLGFNLDIAAASGDSVEFVHAPEGQA